MSGMFYKMLILALVLGLGVGPSSLILAADKPVEKPHEQVITQPTDSQLRGDRLVTGRIVSIRGNQM